MEIFRKCSSSLQTGVNIVEANLWLSTLVENKDICLPLCISVISRADERNLDSLFLASKIIHNLFRESRYSPLIDLSCVEVRYTEP